MIRTIYLRTISLLLSNALVAKSKSPLLVRSQTMSDAGRGFTDIRRLTQATVALVEGILFLRFIIPDHRTAVDPRRPKIANDCSRIAGRLNNSQMRGSAGPAFSVVIFGSEWTR